MHACMYECMYVCMYVCMYECVFVCVYTHVCWRVRVVCMYMYMQKLFTNSFAFLFNDNVLSLSLMC